MKGHVYKFVLRYLLSRLGQPFTSFWGGIFFLKWVSSLKIGEPSIYKELEVAQVIAPGNWVCTQMNK